MEDQTDMTPEPDQKSKWPSRFTHPSLTETTVPLAIRIKQEDYSAMQELAKIYGLRYANEVVARAFQDALDHHDKTA
jgi:hypothetical protein